MDAARVGPATAADEPRATGLDDRKATDAEGHARAEGIDEEIAELTRNGMEPGTAGFHLLRPGSEPLLAPEDADRTEGGRSWWPVETAYYVPYSGDYLPEAVAQVSFTRAFAGTAASYTLVPTGSDRFRVEATFDLQVLRELHGPVEQATRFTDWFATPHPDGGRSTEMRAAVVSDDHAWWPFSVTNLLDGSASHPVVLAKDLDLATARGLVDRLLE